MTINRVIDLTANTTPEVKKQYAEINLKRDVPRFSTQPKREGHVCIVGGGPSLLDCIEELRWRKEAGQQVWATNNTFALLVEYGIMPDVHVLLDSRPETLAFLRPTEGVQYYLNISCPPILFDALTDHKVIMYDLGGVGTGTTVGLKAMYLAGFSGFQRFHLFGMDSSYRDGEHHAYPQALNDDQEVHEVTVDGVKFQAAVWMIYQAEEFQHIATSFADQDCIITVSGDGLLPHIARRISRHIRIVTAVYDLEVCPPTYDFISFLGEVERYRKQIGAESIDMIFMPGSADGFRADNLPDSHQSRLGMIHRVCVGACRLLPSIRNVEVLKTRRRIMADDVFPVEYLKNPTIQFYGSGFVEGAYPCLQATEAARAHVKRKFKKPYITITLRQSSHWPDRNSNIPAWNKVGIALESRGYQIAWVPDIEDPSANEFSWDVDLRFALYEGAQMNLGINNGPTCMLFYSDLPFILFKMVTEGIPWCEPEFFKSIGMLEGPFKSGKLIWGPDTYERIIQEFDLAMNKQEAA